MLLFSNIFFKGYNSVFHFQPRKKKKIRKENESPYVISLKIYMGFLLLLYVGVSQVCHHYKFIKELTGYKSIYNKKDDIDISQPVGQISVFISKVREMKNSRRFSRLLDLRPIESSRGPSLVKVNMDSRQCMVIYFSFISLFALIRRKFYDIGCHFSYIFRPLLMITFEKSEQL